MSDTHIGQYKRPPCVRTKDDRRAALFGCGKNEDEAAIWALETNLEPKFEPTWLQEPFG